MNNYEYVREGFLVTFYKIKKTRKYNTGSLPVIGSNFLLVDMMIK